MSVKNKTGNETDKIIKTKTDVAANALGTKVQNKQRRGTKTFHSCDETVCLRHNCFYLARNEKRREKVVLHEYDEACD